MSFDLWFRGLNANSNVFGPSDRVCCHADYASVPFSWNQRFLKIVELMFATNTMSWALHAFRAGILGTLYQGRTPVTDSQCRGWQLEPGTFAL